MTVPLQGWVLGRESFKFQVVFFFFFNFGKVIHPIPWDLAYLDPMTAPTRTTLIREHAATLTFARLVSDGVLEVLGSRGCSWEVSVAGWPLLTKSTIAVVGWPLLTFAVVGWPLLTDSILIAGWSLLTELEWVGWPSFTECMVEDKLWAVVAYL